MRKIVLTCSCFVFVALTITFHTSTIFAAITEVGGGSQRTGNSGAASSLGAVFPASPGNGSLVCAGGNSYGSSGAVVSVADTLSTTYSVYQAALPHQNNFTAFIACGKTTSSGANTITVSTTGSYISFGIDEFTGQNTTAFLDVDGGLGEGVSSSPLQNITTVAVNALVLAVEADDGGANTSITNGTGWINIFKEENGASWIRYNFAFKVVTTAGTYTADYTIASSQAWGVYAISAKPAVSVATARRRKPILQ